jgi:hypothetical protein
MVLFKIIIIMNITALMSQLLTTRDSTLTVTFKSFMLVPSLKQQPSQMTWEGYQGQAAAIILG